ncbi:glycerophosphodiester phosphodiesterase [Microbacterium pseudoresistens]|uniref:Glycerophosphoryl diester phosphodiesterase n=1 Tax=Microbacterium pseudoresistens TaxID=640634 RepID=A0A7Y9EV72_9MICO|nr:glycerophosphoryl diester phosphodiesterase membrane domain-containing protein [Microbacterium pseudoresistens]NYD53675.1 glycerophosphoryl diester phosphodiesterase [Microbacterium pseudoresistens]
MKRPPLPVRRSLAEGYREAFTRLGRTLVVVAVVQGAVALVAAPLLVALFGLATRASGLTAVTTTTFGQFLRSPAGLAIAITSLVLVAAALLAQAAIFAFIADARLRDGGFTARGVARRLGERLSDLLRRPSTLLLIPYLVLVVPLGQAGIGSVLTRWIAIPRFVTDEIVKTPMLAIAYIVVILLLWWVNLRLIFTIPLLALTDMTAPRALARSWMLTRWRSVRVVALLAGVLVPLAIGSMILAGAALLPTLISDATVPDASLAVASLSLGALQVAVFFFVGVMLMVQAQTLVAALRAAQAWEDAPLTVAGPRRRVGRPLAVTVVTASVLAFGGASAAASGPLDEVADGATLVLAHRGFTASGVENTIPALDAANAAGADLVEMDVQQTADGRWVLMHDTDLKRLAGKDTSVGALTLAEATAITVHDEEGRTAKIPSLREYLQRADELGQQLLIEIKVHGGETPDYVEGLIDLIDEVDGADEHIYHTLSADVVDEFTRLRPDLTIGYIVPISFGGVPDTPASFLVLEQSVYTQQRRDDIWNTGKAVFVWTVQDEADMRELMRDRVDGIITDHPDLAVKTLEDVTGEKGLSARLADAVGRLIATP